MTPETSQLSIIHGITSSSAELRVDVLIDGRRVAAGLRFGGSVGPRTVHAGSHRFEVRAADEAARELVDRVVSIRGGRSLSLLAHGSRGAVGPGIDVVENDVRPLARYIGRLAVHDATADPMLEVELGISPVVRVLPDARFALLRAAGPGDTATLVVAAFVAHSIRVRSPGPDALVVDLDDLRVSGSRSTNVFIVGSASDGSLRLVTESVAAGP